MSFRGVRLVLFILGQTGCVCHNWYVSSKGVDFRRCGSQIFPCKTLRHTAHLANNRDVIYLDGRGSQNHPYGCEKSTTLPEPTPRYINKSLSVIGLHERAYLSCNHGLRFKPTTVKKVLHVSLNNLAFSGNGTSFMGNFSVSIFNCTFTDCFSPLNMTGTRMTLSLEMSVFENNTNCITIQFKTPKSGRKVGVVSVNISSAVFKNNYIQPSKHRKGMVIVNNDRGKTTIQIRNTLFQENYSRNCTCAIEVKSGERRAGNLIIHNSSFLSTSNGVRVTGLLDMHFSNLTFVSNGIALWLTLKSLINDSAFVTLEDSLFSNNSAGLLLELSGQHTKKVTAQIRNCLFNESVHQQSTQLPAVQFQEGSDSYRDVFYEMSLNNVTFRSIRGAALLLCSFTSKRNLKLSIENSRFLDSQNIDFYNRTGYIVYIKIKALGRQTCISGKMASQVHFRNTRFQGNKAYFGIVFLKNVDASFVDCHFTKSYFLSSESALIKHGDGRGNLTIRKGTFLQPRNAPEEHTNCNMTRWPTFISSTNKGHFIIEESTFVASETSPFYPLLTAIKEESVLLDSSTEIQCPVSTVLDFVYWTRKQRILGYHQQCNRNVTTLKVFCDNCPIRTYSLQHGRSAGLKTNQSDCQPCPYGATCLNGIKAKPNFWGYERRPFILTFIPCPLEYCYPRNSSNVSIYNGCHGHRTGTLCGACADGYSEELFSTRCRLKSQCHDDWFWVFTAVYSTALVLFLIFRQPFLSFRWLQTFWYKRTTKEAFQSKDTHFDHGYLKITFYFYQVAGLLLLKDPEHLLSKVNFLFAWFNLFDFEMQYFSEEAGCPFPGLTAVTKELLQCSRVLTTMACSVVIFLIHKGITKACGLKKPSLTFYLAVLMEILLLGYERLADTALSLLHCVPIGSESRLFLNGNVHCWQWWQFGLMAYIVVFVAPFILVLYFGSLFLYSNKVSAMEFMGACALPLPFLFRWAVQYVREKGTTMRQNSSHGEEIKETLHEPFRTPSEEDNGTLYWESVLIGRRFLLLCLHSFITDPMFRLMCLDCACVLILAHHIFKRPYRNMRANVCETVSLLALVAIATFNLAEAVFMSAGIEAAGPNEVGLKALEWVEVGLLGLLPASFCVLVMLGLLSQLFRLITVIIKGSQKIFEVRKRIGFSSAEERLLLSLDTARYS